MRGRGQRAQHSTAHSTRKHSTQHSTAHLFVVVRVAEQRDGEQRRQIGVVEVGQHAAAAVDLVRVHLFLKAATTTAGVIAALQYFTEAVVAASVASGQATTGGGNSALLGYPEGSTLTYAQWLYVMGFKNYYLGYASALAVVMFVVSLGVTLILLRRARSLVYGAEGTR